MLLCCVHLRATLVSLRIPLFTMPPVKVNVKTLSTNTSFQIEIDTSVTVRGRIGRMDTWGIDAWGFGGLISSIFQVEELMEALTAHSDIPKDEMRLVHSGHVLLRQVRRKKNRHPQSNHPWCISPPNPCIHIRQINPNPTSSSSPPSTPIPSKKTAPFICCATRQIEPLNRVRCLLVKRGGIVGGKVWISQLDVIMWIGRIGLHPLSHACSRPATECGSWIAGDGFDE